MALSEQAKAAQREYQRRWRAANRDKVQATNRRYWEKKAAKALEGKNNEPRN